MGHARLNVKVATDNTGQRISLPIILIGDDNELRPLEPLLEYLVRLKSSQHLTPAQNFLLPAEVNAIKDAASEATAATNGWVIDEVTGKVTKDNRPVFKAGFITALRKIIDVSEKAISR